MPQGEGEVGEGGPGEETQNGVEPREEGRGGGGGGGSGPGCTAGGLRTRSREMDSRLHLEALLLVPPTAAPYTLHRAAAILDLCACLEVSGGHFEHRQLLTFVERWP